MDRVVKDEDENLNVDDVYANRRFVSRVMRRIREKYLEGPNVDRRYLAVYNRLSEIEEELWQLETRIMNTRDQDRNGIYRETG